MIDISNLRIEEHGEWARLVADISSDFKRMDDETTIWFAVKKQNVEFLTTDVYNMFLFHPLYMAMYYKSDLYLHGVVSEQLYSNVNTYLQPIMCAFSEDLQKIKIVVDGFGEAREGTCQLIGTGLSGGVDCLTTIYTHYYKEKCEDNKINALFMTTFATDKDVRKRDLFNARCEDMSRIANALGLPFYEIDTNLELFLDLGDRNSYFALYSCAFAIEKVLRKYYISSSLSYEEILAWNSKSKNKDWSEFADPYAIPLMESKQLQLVSDGCQYTRTQKTELISDWDIAQKFLYCCSGKKVLSIAVSVSNVVAHYFHSTLWVSWISFPACLMSIGIGSIPLSISVNLLLRTGERCLLLTITSIAKAKA